VRYADANTPYICSGETLTSIFKDGKVTCLVVQKSLETRIMS